MLITSNRLCDVYSRLRSSLTVARESHWAPLCGSDFPRELLSFPSVAVSGLSGTRPTGRINSWIGIRFFVFFSHARARVCTALSATESPTRADASLQGRAGPQHSLRTFLPVSTCQICQFGGVCALVAYPPRQDQQGTPLQLCPYLRCSPAKRRMHETKVSLHFRHYRVPGCLC